MFPRNYYGRAIGSSGIGTGFRLHEAGYFTRRQSSYVMRLGIRNTGQEMEVNLALL